jgi:histidyl-tRNA synthetase
MGMLKALRGTKDILPGEIEIWQYIEQSARDIFSIYGYREIRTPIVEEAELFKRSIGECTDIVQKEMYMFKDRGERNIALRPEGTASIVRAYLENYSGQSPHIKKFFYIGPMFRAERPQKGRQRQFHQIGVELIGSDEPFRDAEVIYLAVEFLKELHEDEKDFCVKLNSLGCENDKVAIMQKYRESIKPILSSLCEECRTRYDKNVLRLFDCKNSECNKILEDVKAENALCAACTNHFELVKEYLNDWKVKFIIDPKIIRGLDYYTKTVFEITHRKLGAQDAICAGGRYNNLIKDMGGNHTPAIGFAFGIERLLLAIEGEPPYHMDEKLDLFIVATGETLYNEAFKLLNFLRRNSRYSCDVFFEEDSLKAQMRKAQREGAKFVIILGDEESKRKKVLFKNMDTGKQEEVEHNEEVILKKIQGKIK